MVDKNKKIKYKTLEEIKQEVIDALNSADCYPARITRAYEQIFGSSINHSEGENAPEGKFQIVE